MQNQDIVEVKALIRQEIQGYAKFSNKKYGDTPTDALQLVPKKYVDAHAASSIFSGNLIVNGSASVVGSLTVRGATIPAIYIGALNGVMAAGSPFPSGWTASLISAGNCTITHNLGTNNYVVNVTGQATIGTVLNRNSNDFSLVTKDTSNTPTTDVAYFSLLKP